MNIGQLRAAIADLSDDLEIIRRDEFALHWVQVARSVKVDEDGDTIGVGLLAEDGAPYFLID